MSKAWIQKAISRIESDFTRSADTHLIKIPIGISGIDLYLKDESIHPTGSLKHRLARSLFLYSICNGWIAEGTPIVEASSGSTAISEAYFAKLLDLPFHTVVPESTAKEKVKKIEFLGGNCHFVDNSDIYSAASAIAQDLEGHYMDQFTYAERATDWRGNNNIAESLFRQMASERFPEPEWVVMSAGTGGTTATIGRYIRYQRIKTRLCCADPENSVYYEFYNTRKKSLTNKCSSRIEGIGRPRVEASFIPDVIDRMVQVPDQASIAAIRFLDELIDRKCGGSTGTNLWAAIELISEMKQKSQKGSVVSVICDGGERYFDTYYNDAWLAENGLAIDPYLDDLRVFLNS